MDPPGRCERSVPCKYTTRVASAPPTGSYCINPCNFTPLLMLIEVYNRKYRRIPGPGQNSAFLPGPNEDFSELKKIVEFFQIIE